MDLTQYYKIIKYNPSTINNDVLQHQMEKFISDSDLITFFGPEYKNKIIVYADFDKYTSIIQLLPKSKDFCIILLEQYQNVGHWIALLRYGNTIEWFDSYGANPYHHLNTISKNTNQYLGQHKYELSNILDNAPSKFNIIYNKKRFQKYDEKINTCGKHLILRILMMQDFNYTLKDYIKWMDIMKTRLQMTYDEIVATLIVI